MRKIINGRMYDSETATFVGTYTEISNYGVFNWEYYLRECLYKKKTGEFFFVREEMDEAENPFRIDDIIPVTIEEAKLWGEKHLDPDDYIACFGEVEE